MTVVYDGTLMAYTLCGLRDIGFSVGRTIRYESGLGSCMTCTERRSA